MLPINDFITALRETDEYLTDIYTKGSCYKFSLFLCKIYPGAISYVDYPELNHVITKLGDKYYDINGVVDTSVCTEGCKWIPIPDDEIEYLEEWSFRNNHLLQITECPFCEESLTYPQSKYRIKFQEHNWHKAPETLILH